MEGGYSSDKHDGSRFSPLQRGRRLDGCCCLCLHALEYRNERRQLQLFRAARCEPVPNGKRSEADMVQRHYTPPFLVRIDLSYTHSKAFEHV